MGTSKLDAIAISGIALNWVTLFTLLMVGVAFEYRKKLFKSNDNKVKN